MAISIKDEETDRLARALARATGETLTEAIRLALRERLERERRRSRRGAAAGIRRIQERIARLKVRDPRTPEEIIDYDERGLPR